ncbi:MAG TPA: DUF4115 domain-containing protein [Gaiellaceae bacterium]
MGLLATLLLVLLALNMLAWTGGLVDEESSPPPESAPAVTEPPEEPALALPAERPSNEAIAEKRETKRPTQTTTGVTLVLTASRGDCWVEVRAGSSTGEMLYAGTLASGSSLRFNRPRLWLRLGASSNVDLEINGRPSTVPHGTVELLLPDA